MSLPPNVRVSNIGVFQLPPAPLQPPAMELLQSYSDWRTDWTHIVSGKFTDSPFSALLFYEQSTGVAEFYSTDGNGGITLLKHHDGWRQSWSHIVPGFFSDSKREGLLLYDQLAGFGAFYDTDGNGDIILLREQPEWRTDWTQIVAGRFTPSPRSGLLFYAQEAGLGQFYTTDGHGGISRLAEYDDWRMSWTRILAGEFVDHADWGDPRIDDLFFYEGSTGYCETYQSDGEGGISLFGAQPEIPVATHFCAGSFAGTGPTNLLAYDAATGTASVLDIQEQPAANPNDPPPLALWVTLDQYVWEPAWDLVVGGNFWVDDPDDLLFEDKGFTDLLLYRGSEARGDFYLYEPPDPTPIQPFAGYASTRSNTPGDTIGFHVSSQIGTYGIDIFRLGLHETHIGWIQDLIPAAAYPIARTAYKRGLDWPEAGSFELSRDLPSGLYVGRVHTPSIYPGEYGDPTTAYARLIARSRTSVLDGKSLDIPFVIRPAPGRKQRILFAIADNTYEAYNFFGGRSVYGFGRRGQHIWVYPSSSPYRAPYGFRVSFLRSFASNYGVPPDNKWRVWELPFLKWLDRQGIKVDVCTESDLELHSGILAGYHLLVVVGHSEYWSLGMRDQVEQFVKQGGNLAIFSGNTSWWQVRYEDGGNTMVCYKQKEFDPIANDKLKTVNWKEPYVHRPETLLTGLRYAGNPAPDAGFEFVVEDPGHWAFANTGLAQGDSFGRYSPTLTVVGNETDALQPDSPSSFHRLASVSDSGTEIATMGLFSPINGLDKMRGVVFNAATIDWTLGLSQSDEWNAMDQITRNVLIRLG